MAGDGESFVTMLLNSSDTESSPEGWVISGNETGQTLTFWGNAPDSCYSTFVAYPEEFLPSFKLCTGAGGLWANYLSTFRLGTISLDSFAQATQNQVAVLTAPNAGCALATLYGVGSPLGNGAWSFNAVQGEASAVPSTYGVPPSYCPAPSLRKSGA